MYRIIALGECEDENLAIEIAEKLRKMGFKVNVYNLAKVVL